MLHAAVEEFEEDSSRPLLRHASAARPRQSHPFLHHSLFVYYVHSNVYVIAAHMQLFSPALAHMQYKYTGAKCTAL